MDPVVGTILGGINIGMQLFGASEEAKAQKRQAEFAAQQLEFNSRMAERDANEIVKRADLDVQQFQRKGALVRGAQRASMAAQGIDIDSGSAQAIAEETNANLVEDITNIKNNAIMEAYGYRVQASQMRQQANMTRAAGRQAASNTLLAGGARAVSGAASTYSNYQQAQYLSTLTGSKKER